MNNLMLGRPGNINLELRTLIAHFGMTQVYNELNNIFKSDYVFLTQYFEGKEVGSKKSKEKEQVKEKEKEIVMENTITTFVEVSPNIDEPIETKEKKTIHTKGVTIKVKKEETPSTEEILEEDEVNQAKPPFTTTHPPKGLSPNEVKKWQKEQEMKRAEELKAQGIQVSTLLTEENLRKWIEKEGRAYSQIARDLLGIPEHEVSEAAKKYGIQSAIAKRRAAILAGRLRKN